jgi:hypothetical protein
MATVQLQLEEQASDIRSSEIAYRFTAENKGAKTVHLRSLTSRAADGAAPVVVRDTSERAVRFKHETLCEELSATLKSYLRRIDPGPTAGKGLLERLRGAPGNDGPAKIPAPTVVHDLTSEHAETAKHTIDFTIAGAADAQYALEIWFKEVENAPERRLFEAKLAQLRRYEEQMEKEGGTTKTAIATIAPGAVFATTYVFRYKRGQIDAKRYTVTVEASYTEDGADVVETGTAAASSLVSPSPVILSVVAVVSSLLGALLKAAIAARAEPAATLAGEGGLVWTALHKLGQQLTPELVSLQMLGAIVLALVVFNIYEHTEFGNRVKMGVGWRSAMLIGVLSGAFTERLLEALKVLAGVQ